MFEDTLAVVFVEPAFCSISDLFREFSPIILGSGFGVLLFPDGSPAFEGYELLLRDRVGEAECDEVGGSGLSPVREALAVHAEWDVGLKAAESGRGFEVHFRS